MQTFVQNDSPPSYREQYGAAWLVVRLPLRRHCMVRRQDYVDTFKFSDVGKPGLPMMAPQFQAAMHDMPNVEQDG